MRYIYINNVCIFLKKVYMYISYHITSHLLICIYIGRCTFFHHYRTSLAHLHPFSPRIWEPNDLIPCSLAADGYCWWLRNPGTTRWGLVVYPVFIPLAAGFCTSNWWSFGDFWTINGMKYIMSLWKPLGLFFIARKPDEIVLRASASPLTPAFLLQVSWAKNELHEIEGGIQGPRWDLQKQ